MAEDWKRRRDREDEAEQEEALKKNSSQTLGSTSREGAIPSEKFDEFIQRAEILIDQLNNLYNMFAAGAEQLPPAEKRRQLDQLMVTLTYTGKPTPSMLFKCNSIVSRYTTYKERWDRMLKDVESGKIKRVAGPKNQRRPTRQSA